MNIIQKIIQNWKIIITALCLIFFVLLLNQCSTSKKLKEELKRQEQKTAQNMAALNDSITVYKNLAGQTSYSKPIADMSVEEIKKYFPNLYDKLKNELGEVKIIWKTKLEYKDTGSVKNTIIKLDSNQYALSYDYFSKDSTLHINSTNVFFADAKLIDELNNKYTVIATPGISTINDISLKMGFTTGIKKENNLYKIFITPDNKNVIIGQIEGADVSNLLSPPSASSKNKRWSIGPYIGFAIKINKNVIEPGAGVSLQYSLIRF